MTRAFALAAAALLVVATVTHHWLHHWDDPYGLFAFYPPGRSPIPYTNVIQVWRESNFDVITTYVFVIAGIVVAVANAVMVVVLVILSARNGRWLRRVAWGALVLACAACSAFLYTKPDWGDVGVDFERSAVTRYHASWSLVVFAGGVALAAFALGRLGTRSAK